MFESRYIELCITTWALYEEWQMGTEQELVDAVLGRARQNDGTKDLPCAEAFELARQYRVKVNQIGRICNRHNVKIRKCQLGCFP